ncbi:MAG: hypothetical protein V2I97_05940, partial [Desulfococcaceae bacterium]|nr:hypothetical protein [Desulfococcaceae bacterium]
YRGQLIYCYIPPNTNINETQSFIKSTLKTVLEKGEYPEKVPILMVLLNDHEAKLGKMLAEYWVLSNELTGEEEQKFSNFIKNYNNQLIEDIRFSIEGMIQERLYVFPDAFDLENIRLKKITDNLFAQTYPKIIPFPFDGFQTARGNAAKSCREITVELIKGTLNEDWITSAAPEVKNRSVTLLEEWGALGSDGKIAWLPSHSKVRELISELDQKMKNEGNINLGEICKTLVMPPYGFNIASVGLMLGVFFSPRKENTVLIYKGEDISPAVWAGNAFSGYFLNPKILEETFIRHISDDESDKWTELLGKWDSEQTHSGRINFMQEAENLKERIPLPGERRDRWLRLNEEAEKSFAAVREFESLIEDQDERFFRAWEKEEVRHICFTGVKLNYQLQKMLNEEHRWTPDQLNTIPPRIDKIKQAIIHFFDPWLRQQIILKSQQIGKYNHEMIEQTGRNLQTLGLSDLFKKLERHVRKNVARIEELEKISFIVDETRAFLDSHQAGSDSKISELNDRIKKCGELSENLLKAKKKGQDIADIDRLLKRMNKFTAECKKIKEMHKEEANKLWNLEFNTLEDIRTARIKVKNLMGIYFGQEMDMDDLTMMDKQLGQFERDFTIWNDAGIPNSDLKKMVSDRISEIMENQDDEDEPPWDSEVVYNNFLHQILHERHKEAVRWMEGVALPFDPIEKMPAEKCQTLLNRLDLKPAYLGDEQIKSLMKMKAALEKRLDDLQVEGLLVRFRQLPEILQKEFLKLAVSEVNG